MKSVVELEIGLPRAKVAKLFTDPRTTRSGWTTSSGSSVSRAVFARFLDLPGNRTKLVSEETFNFKGTFSRIFGVFARPAIKRAHRHHMDSFKRFAEGGF